MATLPYRTAVVQATAGRSMLVRLESGDDRLLPVPEAPVPSLVGATVLVRDDHEWVVTAGPWCEDESVRRSRRAPDGGSGGIDLREAGPAGDELDPEAGSDARILPFDRRR